MKDAEIQHTLLTLSEPSTFSDVMEFSKCCTQQRSLEERSTEQNPSVTYSLQCTYSLSKVEMTVTAKTRRAVPNTDQFQMQTKIPSAESLLDNRSTSAQASQASSLILPFSSFHDPRRQRKSNIKQNYCFITWATVR